MDISSRFTETEVRLLESEQPQPREGFISFPTPEDNQALTLLNLRDTLGTDPARPPSFFDHPWYLEEPFAEIPCPPGWHSVASAVMPGSVGQPIYYADSIKSGNLYLASAAEMTLMLLLNFTLTGERLLLDKHTWTQDRTQNRRFVTVGAFGKKGLFVSSHDVGYRSRGLGICPVAPPKIKGRSAADPTIGGADRQ